MTVKIEAQSSNDSINAIMDITVSKKTSVPEKIKFIFAFDNYNSNQVKKVEFRCNSQTYSYKTLPTSLVVDYQYETILEDFVIYFYKEHIDAMPQTVKTGSRPISRVQVKRDDAVIFAEPFYYNFNESDGQSNFFSESKDLSIQCSEGEGTVEYYVNIINPVN